MKTLGFACMLLSLSVICLIGALWFVSHRYAPVIVVSPECKQTAYNNGANYEYQKRRWLWRHV